MEVRIMFKDVEETIQMLKGAYRKLKSYYYYNKNFILMREKIADFEYNRNVMEKSFEDMAKAICKPKSNSSKKFFDEIINRIDFFVIPKKFDMNPFRTNSPVSNTLQRDKKMKAVNFFIDAPIEIYIYDTLWTVLIGKMDYDMPVLSFDVYGNTINKSALYNMDGTVLFENRVLFNRYFDKYTDWRNNAFKAMEENYEKRKDSILISLDIKSYFYSVRFCFELLNKLFPNHSLIEEIKPLTKLMNRVFEDYCNKVAPYRKDLKNLKEQEYFLPIGLFSSMLLGNLYLSDLDRKVREIDKINYYGRYVDDILIVLNKSIGTDVNNQEIMKDVFVKTEILKEEEKNMLFVDMIRF